MRVSLQAACRVRRSCRWTARPSVSCPPAKSTRFFATVCRRGSSRDEAVHERLPGQALADPGRGVRERTRPTAPPHSLRPDFAAFDARTTALALAEMEIRREEGRGL